jgi:hypothetical protein
MCHSEATIYSMTVEIAMEIGRDDAPDCCGAEMTRAVNGDDLTYTCGCCGTAVDVDEVGLVDDIREKTAA